MALSAAPFDDVRIGLHPLGQDGGALVIETYRIDAIYSIDDRNPWLCIGLTARSSAKMRDTVKAGKLDRVPDGQVPADGRHWWRWQPFAADDADIGRHRRYGLYQTELHQPLALPLRCYAWPGRFFDPERYVVMLAEIEAELGRAIEWEHIDIETRASARARRGRPTDAELLGTVQAELRAARILDRIGALSDGTELDETPEARFVTMWAWRRLADLAALRQRTGASGSGDARDHNQNRAARNDRRAAAAREDGRTAAQMMAQISRIAERGRLARGTVELSPAMQRDHRLRRLVRAFGPATREHWAGAPTGALSTLPPLKAPDVFELWGLVRLLRALADQGWTRFRARSGRTSAEGAATALEYHVAELRRGDWRLVVEYQAEPDVLDCETAPAMHERRMPLIEWAGLRASGPDRLIATHDLRPDYVLRLSSDVTGPHALAIGDATLSDPKHVLDGRGHGKSDRLIEYRDHLAWRAGDCLIRCAPAATFIVLPGPPSRWSGLPWVSQIDSLLMFPDPAAVPDDDFGAKVAALVETMEAPPS